MSLPDFSEDLLRRFLCEYRRSHAAATTNSKRCQLIALWRAAWEEGLLPEPPRAKRIRKSRAASAIPEAWEAEEVGRILWAATETPGRDIAGIDAVVWWQSFLRVLYDTGERRKATLATEPSDVSLDGAWIIFRKTKTAVPRYCPLHPDTIVWLRRIYDPCSSRVWPWPYSREALDKRIHKILALAGVRHGKGKGGLLHKMRRTTGTLVEQAGGDGAKAIGDTRKVFLASYLDPRFLSRTQLARLPRP
jgi:integrase